MTSWYPAAPTARRGQKLSPVELFWEKVNKTEGCWLWTASLAGGYGQVWWNGALRGAHRVSWAIASGAWPDLCVLHKCDIRNCVNPDHLFLGTKKDNARDMDEKGRRVSRPSLGESHGNAVLTDDAVRAIRRERSENGAFQRDLAAKYGISRSLVGAVLTRKRWRHVE